MVRKGKKRVTPIGDYVRFAHNLENFSGGNIIDRDSFDVAYDGYMGTNLKTEMDSTMRNKAFEHYQEEFQSVSNDKIHHDAGGQSLRKDRAHDAKKIVSSVKEYQKEGAENVDLAGYDTRQNYSHRGKIGSKTVYAKSVRIQSSRGKYMDRYRDRKGRFVKVNRT